MGSGVLPLAMAARFPEGRCQKSDGGTAAVRSELLNSADIRRKRVVRVSSGRGGCRRRAWTPAFAGALTRPAALLAQRGASWRLPLGAGGSSIERLVPVGCGDCSPSTSGLSTWWSTTALKRDLVLRGVSRLDAFSGYPVRTWLPGGAAGATTGPPEVRPSRSSRTGESASQVSNTRGR